MKWLALLLAVFCLSASLPPLPVSTVRIANPRLASPKETAFRAGSVAMVISPRLLTNYGYCDFPSTAVALNEVNEDGQPIVFSFTNLIAWVDVSTNNGPWFRKREAAYPPYGGRMWVTNVAPAGTLIYFRTGYTFISY